MKGSEAVSHEKSRRWKIWRYSDQMALLGPVEVAVYTTTRRELLMRLSKNENFMIFIPQIFVCLHILIDVSAGNINRISNVLYIILSAFSILIEPFIIYSIVQDMKTPRFAVCERGLWIDNATFSWEIIQNCYWNRFNENELIVKSGKAFRLAAIPADRCEEVEAALRKRDKMKPLVEPTI